VFFHHVEQFDKEWIPMVGAKLSSPAIGDTRLLFHVTDSENQEQGDIIHRAPQVRGVYLIWGRF
jgi:hypothetical protein